jgi:hypothetical protein
LACDLSLVALPHVDLLELKEYMESIDGCIHAGVSSALFLPPWWYGG